MPSLCFIIKNCTVEYLYNKARVFYFYLKGVDMDDSYKRKSNLNSNGAGKVWWQPALVLFARLSVWIVIPVLAGIFIGKWLDKKYDSEPWLFLGSVGIAFIISIFALIILISKEYKKIGDELKNKQ